MRQRKHSFCFQRNSLTAAVLSALASFAQALPQGGNVTAGTGSLSESGSNLTVNQGSQKLVIDWQSFGIAAGESVQFVQPNSSAVALNRVLGNNRSEIFGSLSANGQVFLTNPNGILFGPTAQVDVGGLVASTLAISNEDFLAGNYVFSGDDGGAISNQGELRAADGGVIALLAPEVRNEGLILAKAGAIGIGAGTRVRLDLADGFSLEVEESALNAVIENRQAIRAESGVIVLSATARQSLLAGVINNTGVVDASSVSQQGGRIFLRAGLVSQAGTLDASGATGGAVRTQSHGLLQAGQVLAQGSMGDGGSIVLSADRVVETLAARDDASGAADGGLVRIHGRESVSSSATLRADGAGQGGHVDVLGNELILAAATVTATGGAGGGEIHVGGDYQGSGPRPNATSVWINPFTTLDASATANGDGGTVIVWSDSHTAFGGAARARGGAAAGNGGLIEVSGGDTLQFAGQGDAGAVNGAAGTLLLDPKNILISDSVIPALQVIPLPDPTPTAGDQHGAGPSLELANGNIVQVSAFDDFAATDAGAVYLYRQSDGALLSMLTGSSAEDHVGSAGITALASGNFVVSSDDWNNGAALDAGAITWGSASLGVSGVVSAANSLVGSSTGDRVGTDSQGGSGVFLLSNGNYVVRSPDWDNGGLTDAGAATWGSGTSGVSGTITAVNSLVGSSAFDRVAGRELDYAETPVIEVGGGNYVVGSSQWDNGSVTDAGAATWGNGASGVAGVISAGNSLVGTRAGDRVSGPNQFTGVSGLVALDNGNYLVSSSDWDNGAIANAGAVTFGLGSSGVAGAVSAGNSLVGGSADDSIGFTGGFFGGNGTFVELANGNYVLANPNWDNGAAVDAGAVTWGSGTSGVTGVVSAANSLVGSQSDDLVGFSGVTALANGNYVVLSSDWNNGAATGAGAVTFGNGATGTSGVVSGANSLVGTQTNDHVGERGIFELTNGNYVVVSPDWDNGAVANAGAVTWGSGTTGRNGVVSEGNSLVGSHVDDHVGVDGITALANGNYVIRSSSWSDGVTSNVSAVTWAYGGAATSGIVSAANSLVGSHTGDDLGNSGITAFNNGNYVVNSPDWDNGAAVDAGAVTWGDGAAGSNGVLDAGNSLVGTSSGDRVGAAGIQVLANQNYVVGSPYWSNGGAVNAGAATWGSDVSGIAGEVSGDNSLVGSNTNDFVGQNITVLGNSNYVVVSPEWDNGSAVDAGAVTWGNGSAPVTGAVSDSNSIYGSTANDRVGLGGITELANGHFVINSYQWNNGAIPGAIQAGAVTWANGFESANFDIDAGNSLVGTQAGDLVGIGGVTALNNGNYVVSSYAWDNGSVANAGAVTWGKGDGGTTGEVRAANSLVGSTADDVVGNGGITRIGNGNYLVYSPDWHAGPAAPRAGAMTLVDGELGVAGAVGNVNSLVGDQVDDRIGSGEYRELANGNVLVRSPEFHNGTGRVDILPLASADFPLSGNLSFGDAAGRDVRLHTRQITNILNTGTNLVLQANNEISVESAILVNNPSGNGGDFTLQAGNRVALNADIFTDNGDLTVVANERYDRGVIASEREPGQANLSVELGTEINAGTGDIRLLMAGEDNPDNKYILIGGDVTARRIAVLNYAHGGHIYLGDDSVLTATGTGLSLVVGTTNHGAIITDNGSGHLQTPNGSWLTFTRSAPLIDYVRGDASGVTDSGQVNEEE